MLAECELFEGRFLLLDLDTACLVHDADMADFGSVRVEVKGSRVLLLVHCCSVHLLIWSSRNINSHFIVGTAISYWIRMLVQLLFRFVN